MVNRPWIVLLLAFLAACATSAPEGETAGATTADDLDVEEEAEEVEIPPEGALPLSVILGRLEAKDYTQIVEAEFEDGVWEIEYIVDGEERELRVDPMTGEILPEKAEEDAESEAS